MSDRSVARRVERLIACPHQAALERARNERLRSVAAEVKRDNPAKSFSDCLVEVVLNTFGHCACGRALERLECPMCRFPSRDCECPKTR